MAEKFDPWEILGALERHHVNYVLIGALAGVLHAMDEIARGVDICPQMKEQNLERFRKALSEVDRDLPRNFQPAERSEVETSSGLVAVMPEPPGSSGWDDRQRASTREPIGRGVRVTTASVDDLGRLMTSFERTGHGERLAVLRRLSGLERARAMSR